MGPDLFRPKEKGEVIFKLNKSTSFLKGKYFLDKEEVAFDQLETALMSKVTPGADETIVVRIPYNLQVQDLVDVLQIGVKNKLKFVIATSNTQ